MKKISVIIPGYNVENYIDRCIETVIGQTIGPEQIEILLVNDASQDQTLRVMLAWEEKYPENVMVINCEENNGCGGARNVGLQYASGEYVFFVDADDWLEKDALEELYSHSAQESYDIVTGKMIFDRKDAESNMQEIHQYEAAHRSDFSYQAGQVDGIYVWEQRAIREGNIGGMPTSVGALYRRSLILENQLFFPEKVDYEDNYWRDTLKIYFSGMYIVDKVIYHYCYNEESITQKRNSIRIEDRLFMELNILENYKKNGAFDHYKEDLEYNFIRRFYLNTVFVLFTNYDYIPDIINYLRKTVLRLFPDYKKNYIMERANEREKCLIRWLEREEDLTMEELQEFKQKYLQMLYEER